ncbi:MAG: prepilin-type N-terminal cleavage/methylation domain-containing protein [Candidatus Peregrinibacteria bacterium]|nr:prepilin-type N-terminal cleavage/methylation domain-containing protein [Candidatus Peregrinibacteria bacterium]
MKFNRRQTGFTLIEVLLVVIIMAIITTGAFSGMLNLQRTSRVNAINRQFSNFLELARSYSLNGKLVNSGCDNGKTECVPKSFSVITQKNDPKCTTSPNNRSVRLIYQKATASGFNPNDIVTMDSFCVNPKIEYWYVGPNNAGEKFADDIPFSYTPPFGTFAVDDQISSAPQKITLTFCETATDTKKCTLQNTYTKAITLYTNVGVLE